MNHLELFHQGDKVDDYSLGQEELSIGRDPCSIIHIEHSFVSWRHARIYPESETWIIEDRDSTNGTVLNGKEISKHLLKIGDRIDIGDFTLIVKGDDRDASTYMASEFTMLLDNDLRQELIAGGDQTENKDKITAQQRVRSGNILHKVSHWLCARFPVLQWAAGYDKEKNLRGDLIAGVTVAAMLIPQGMAYAMLAGLPPIIGLYASLIPPLIYALMGTSRQLSVGPVAIDSLLVATGVGALAELGSGSFIVLAILLAAMVGLIQLFMGLTRLGFVVNFLSTPVLTGFTTAAALVIGFSQLKHLLGIALPQTHHVHSIILSAFNQLTDINPFTFAIGVCSIALIILLKRWNRKIPGAITVVIIATCLVWLFGLDARDVKIVGQVPSGLPAIGLPEFNMDAIQSMLPLALTIALVGFTEAIAVAKTFAAKNHYRVDANQELIALGTANLIGSLFKGYPVTGGFSRTAVNAQAGANTGLASIITAILIAITLLLLTPLFYYLPIAVLAAIIMTAVSGLIDSKQMRYLFKVKKSEGGLLVITLIATLSLGIIQGLLLGVIASILLFITINTRPHAAILGRLPGTDIFRNIKHFPQVELVPGLIILRIDASFYFANTEFLKEKLHGLVETNLPSLRALILDASSINDLDSSADTALHEVVADFGNRGIELYIAGVKGPVRQVMKRSGLYEALGADHFFFSIDAAVKRYESISQLDQDGANNNEHCPQENN